MLSSLHCTSFELIQLKPKNTILASYKIWILWHIKFYENRPLGHENDCSTPSFCFNYSVLGFRFVSANSYVRRCVSIRVVIIKCKIRRCFKVSSWRRGSLDLCSSKITYFAILENLFNLNFFYLPLNTSWCMTFKVKVVVSRTFAKAFVSLSLNRNFFPMLLYLESLINWF